VVEEALLLYHRTFALHPPHPKIVDDISRWIKGAQMGAVILIGEDAD
jgi:hypothetical protein